MTQLTPTGKSLFAAVVPGSEFWRSPSYLVPTYRHRLHDGHPDHYLADRHGSAFEEG